MTRARALGGLGVFVSPSYTVEGAFMTGGSRPDEGSSDATDAASIKASFHLLSLRHRAWLEAGVVWLPRKRRRAVRDGWRGYCGRRDRMARLHIVRLAIVALSMAGCVRPPQGAKHPQVPDVTIVTAEEGARLGISPVRASLTFGTGEDGTRVVVRFLKAAQHRGARYVSDLRVVIVSEHDGEPMACETRIVPVEEFVNVTVPGGFKTVPTLTRVSRWVTESEYRCRMVSKPVTRSETTYESQYDSFSKRTRTVPRTRMVTRYESRQECRFEPVRRLVRRYEYQYRTQYVPPRLEAISVQKLKETKAVCYVPRGTDGVERMGKSRVEAKLYVPSRN